jgi:serine/threonine protein kinase
MSSIKNSYVASYEYGCILNNHCKVGEEYFGNVVPFEIEHTGHEKMPVFDKKSKSNQFRVSKYCNLYKKTKLGTKIYILSAKNFNELFMQITQSQDVTCLQQVVFNTKDNDVDDYIVKVVPVKNWRDANTSTKEMYMTNMIYNATHLSCKGIDIACKPYFGCLFWNGNQWKYLSVYEKARGISLSCIYKHKYFNYKYNKEQILLDVSKAVQSLWLLGFAHNDLYNSNVVYDMKTHSVKIIDFEMAVKLPDHIVSQLHDALYKKRTETVKIGDVYCHNIATTFDTIAKKMAISLLSLAKSTCHVNTDDDGIIYNTDETFLPMLYEHL